MNKRTNKTNKNSENKQIQTSKQTNSKVTQTNNYTDQTLDLLVVFDVAIDEVFKFEYLSVITIENKVEESQGLGPLVLELVHHVGDGSMITR